MKMISLDTRTLRNAHGLWTAGKNKSVCDLCARVEACDLANDEVRACETFIPALGFAPPLLGLDGAFNTIRLGEAWFCRLLNHKGAVALVNTKTMEVIGLAKVRSVATDKLKTVLSNHAAANHLMLEEDAETAPDKLFHYILKNYGPHLVSHERKATVIYLERIKK